MDQWRRLPVPSFCERLIGFSVPQEDTVLVVSYEATHLVHLGPPVRVETDAEHGEYDLYDPETGICPYLGKPWDILGLHPGRPLLTGRGGERLVLNAEAQTLSVLDDGEVAWSSTFENFSGDWAAATFSPDGRFIVLGCPYDFDFRVFERVTHSG